MSSVTCIPAALDEIQGARFRYSVAELAAAVLETRVCRYRRPLPTPPVTTLTSIRLRALEAAARPRPLAACSVLSSHSLPRLSFRYGNVPSKSMSTTNGTSPSFVGAIDQGTTSSRFIIFDEHAQIIASHQLEFPQSAFY